MSNPGLETRGPVQTCEAAPRSQSFVSSKIDKEHLSLGAVLYVRQSTSHQLREHQESTARQYALRHRLVLSPGTSSPGKSGQVINLRSHRIPRFQL